MQSNFPDDEHGYGVQPDLTEARRLLAAGFKLCKLDHQQKKPEGDGWQLKPVTAIDPKATGYGAMLALNGLCSIDPDRVDESRKILAAFGFDLDELMDAGARTCSTRPGSGGRSVFNDGGGLAWVKFSFNGLGTVLELRARSTNLQDVLPGLVYRDKEGELRTQAYVGEVRIDDRPALPEKFAEFWQRLSTDVEFLREMQRKAGDVLGIASHIAISTGGDAEVKLAYSSAQRVSYNDVHDVPEILARHSYTEGNNGRWAPPTATGAPCVRLIPGKESLWRSDHASDPLWGTFDAWTAFVMLDHGGDLDAAEKAFGAELQQMVTDDFADESADDNDDPGAADSEVVVADSEAAPVAPTAPPAAAKDAPPDDPLDGIKERFDHTDAGNVNLLVKLTKGNLRFVPELKLWLFWTGKRWERDTSKAYATTQAMRVGMHYLQKAAAIKKRLDTADASEVKAIKKQLDIVQAWAKTCRNLRGINSMLDLAARDARFIINEERLDADPHVLGVQNGVVDLRTGELKPDGRDNFVTLRCAVEYHADAQASRFTQLVDEVTGYPIPAEFDDEGQVVKSSVGRYRSRPAYATYMQRALGYSITGHNRDQKLFVCYGETGSNGKNRVVDAVRSVLGVYAVKAKWELLMATRNSDRDANKATPALVQLKKARVVLMSEPSHGCRFDNSVVKELTGEEGISSRGLYGEAKEMAITFAIWLLANAKPSIEHMEGAMVGRIVMAPFDRSWNRPGTVDHDPRLPDGDPQLADALKVEAEGILAWLVRGAVDYYREGLEPCEEVRSTTIEYLRSQDPVSQWLDEHEIVSASECLTPTSVLFDDFQAWADLRIREGERFSSTTPHSPVAFGNALVARKIERHRPKGSAYPIRLLVDHKQLLRMSMGSAGANEFGAAGGGDFDDLVRQFGDLA